MGEFAIIGKITGNNLKLSFVKIVRTQPVSQKNSFRAVLLCVNIGDYLMGVNGVL